MLHQKKKKEKDTACMLSIILPQVIVDCLECSEISEIITLNEQMEIFFVYVRE
jgi:hypothetical protein